MICAIVSVLNYHNMLCFDGQGSDCICRKKGVVRGEFNASRRLDFLFPDILQQMFSKNSYEDVGSWHIKLPWNSIWSISV